MHSAYLSCAWLFLSLLKRVVKFQMQGQFPIRESNSSFGNLFIFDLYQIRREDSGYINYLVYQQSCKEAILC